MAKEDDVYGENQAIYRMQLISALRYARTDVFADCTEAQMEALVGYPDTKGLISRINKKFDDVGGITWTPTVPETRCGHMHFTLNSVEPDFRFSHAYWPEKAQSEEQKKVADYSNQYEKVGALVLAASNVATNKTIFIGPQHGAAGYRVFIDVAVSKLLPLNIWNMVGSLSYHNRNNKKWQMSLGKKFCVDTTADMWADIKMDWAKESKKYVKVNVGWLFSAIDKSVLAVRDAALLSKEDLANQARGAAERLEMKVNGGLKVGKGNTDYRSLSAFVDDLDEVTKEIDPAQMPGVVGINDTAT